MDIVCGKILEEINKTTKICEFYNVTIESLHKYSVLLNNEVNNNNINKSYYDKILEKLNELYDLYKVFNKLTVNESLESILSINDDNINLFFNDKYTINKPDIKKYQIHPQHESNCIITHIDKTNEIFYIMDTANTEKYNKHHEQLNNLYCNKSELQLINIDNQLPKLSNVFGIIKNNKIYRAIRENKLLLNNNDKYYNVYLLDTGEIEKLSINDKIYTLPLDLQNEPAIAICCKLDSIILNNNMNGDRDSFFLNGLYQKFYFYVQSVDELNGILNIKLMSKINPFLDYLNDYEYDWIGLEKIDSHEESKINEYKYNHEDNVNNNYDKDSLDDSISSSNIDNSSKIITIPYNELNLKTYLESNSSGNNNVNNPLTNDDKLLENGLTKDQYDMLMQEPLQTSNALKAVTGYIPKDDKLICKHSKNGKCFKGSRCKLQHIQKIQEGWTRDCAQTVIDINMKIVYPKINSIITIVITHIINIEYFWAQIMQDNCRDPTLREMALKMNTNDEIQKYEDFVDELPVLFELVIAKYTDGFYYRAKIIDFDDDNYFKVFYVDYGNCDTIPLSYIRKWETRFERIPFQAISFHLDGIRCIKDKSFESEEYMRNIVLNKTTKAKVINIIGNDIRVHVQLLNNCDLSEELIKLGYATKATNYDFKNTNNVQNLPG